jgi:hypothetical protein
MGRGAKELDLKRDRHVICMCHCIYISDCRPPFQEMKDISIPLQATRTSKFKSHMISRSNNMRKSHACMVRGTR